MRNLSSPQAAIIVTLVAALAGPSTAGSGVAAQESAILQPAAKAKIKIRNETACKVGARFFGEKLPENGKLRSVKPGKARGLTLKAPGSRYRWEASAACCAAGTGEFDAPLQKKGNASVTFRCAPPLKTIFDVTSKSFVDTGDLPEDFSCDGNVGSPPLSIHNVPIGTMSFVLTSNDRTSPANSCTGSCSTSHRARANSRPRSNPATTACRAATICPARATSAPAPPPAAASTATYSPSTPSTSPASAYPRARRCPRSRRRWPAT